MKVLILLFSSVHRFVCLIKNFLYEKKFLSVQRSPLPVISIGNITFGGTEKTPLAMELIAYFHKKGYKPALITRGYRGKWEKKGGILSNGKALLGSWQEGGDEAFQVARNFPQAGVFVGRNRLLSCNRAKELGFDLAIMDDGFQHRRLFRNLDIVLFNPREKLTLREPLSALKRTDIVLVKKEFIPEAEKILFRLALISRTYQYTVACKGLTPLGQFPPAADYSLRGKTVLAFCGIAQPERFSELIEREGGKIICFFIFPDHYPYPFSAVKKIREKFDQLKPHLILTTEKDAIKITSYQDYIQMLPLFYLKIRLEVEEAFFADLESSLGQRI